MGIQKRKSSRFGCFFLVDASGGARSKGLYRASYGNDETKRRGNSWKKEKEGPDTGVHTGRPPHIIEGTERPVPAFEQPVTGETEAGEEEED